MKMARSRDEKMTKFARGAIISAIAAYEKEKPDTAQQFQQETRRRPAAGLGITQRQSLFTKQDHHTPRPAEIRQDPAVNEILGYIRKQIKENDTNEDNNRKYSLEELAKVLALDVKP